MRTQWLKTLIPAMALVALPVLPAVSEAGVAIGVSITLAPPVLPVYVQPPLPAPGYIWTPGYWAWGDDGYYWVPGTWVLPPQPGVLWTPGYWGWVGGVYLWHAGYWGPHVGFYGGVNYGFGYTGVGFQGGYWRGGGFFYNRAVMNVGSVHVTNVYNRTVINNVTVNRVSFNGGQGGIQAHATGPELAAEHEHHFQSTAAQTEHQHSAFSNHDLRASVNHGAPPVAATERPGQFSGRGVVAARGSGSHGGPAQMMHNTPGARVAEGGHGGPGPAGHSGAFGGAHGPVGPAGHATPMVHNDRPPGAGMGHPNGFAGGGHSAPTGGSHPAPNVHNGFQGGGGFPGGGHSAPPNMSRPAPNMGGGRPAPRPNGGGGRPQQGGHPQQQEHRSGGRR